MKDVRAELASRILIALLQYPEFREMDTDEVAIRSVRGADALLHALSKAPAPGAGETLSSASAAEEPIASPATTPQVGAEESLPKREVGHGEVAMGAAPVARVEPASPAPSPPTTTKVVRHSITLGQLFRNTSTARTGRIVEINRSSAGEAKLRDILHPDIEVWALLEQMGPGLKWEFIPEDGPCQAFGCGLPGELDAETDGYFCHVHVVVPASIRKEWHAEVSPPKPVKKRARKAAEAAT